MGIICKYMYRPTDKVARADKVHIIACAPSEDSELPGYTSSLSSPRGYETLFMLNSTEHEISTAYAN